EFWLISEGVASAPTVYSFLKNETKVFLTFVPLSESKTDLLAFYLGRIFQSILSFPRKNEGEISHTLIE
ncbi:TPA: hypothetical protein ACH6DF_002856, partial [Enterococcus faecium]